MENGIGYGGAIICLRHLVRNLDKSRYEAMVITGRGGEQYEDIANDVRWKHIPDRHIDIAGMKQHVNNSRGVYRFGAVRLVVNQLLSRLDDLGNFLPHFLQLLWTAARFRPDIIHANNEPLCNRAAILSGKILHIPVVNHVRGDLGPDKGGSSIIRWLYRLPDRFITVSQWISDSIGQFGVPQNKRDVVYDGIQLDDMDINADGSVFRKESGIVSTDFAVGLVGLLIPWKGQQLFLDAAAALAGKIPGLKMMIVGGTPDDCIAYEKELRERVKRDGLEDIVVFTGHVSSMPQVYNGLDVVVGASTSPEPLGTMVIECLAMGRPLVAPDHGGSAEITAHEKTAMLFKPGDSKSLAKMIHRLHAQQGLRDQLGKAARADALSRFSVATHVQSVCEIYEEMLDCK